MSEWKFYFQPNIFGSPDEPDYMPGLSRYEIINNIGMHCMVGFDELRSIEPEDWHQYLECVWQNFIEGNEG